MGSPTQRSLAYLRRLGHTAAVVEKSIPWPRPRGTKIDLYGFGDVLSFDESDVTITQTTSTANIQSRIKKTLANPIAYKWLLTPGRRIEVHGWAKRTWKLKDGSRAASKRWALTRYFVTRDNGSLQIADPVPSE